ncbi:MAG: hypothetical protein ACE5JU_25765 [Candidatus Binatia bacterium]
MELLGQEGLELVVADIILTRVSGVDLFKGMREISPQVLMRPSTYPSSLVGAVFVLPGSRDKCTATGDKIGARPGNAASLKSFNAWSVNSLRG